MAKGCRNRYPTAKTDMKPTVENLAGLSMTLSHALQVSEDDTDTMKGLFILLRQADNLIDELSVQIPPDMTNLSWQTFMCFMLMELSHNGEDITQEEIQKLYPYIKTGMENLVDNRALANHMAQEVLGELYPPVEFAYARAN